MSIKVCDAIMGSGKTESAITYMNEHPQQKFIYITPFLEEASRIKECCPRLHFAEPSDKLPQFKFSKSNHTASLIEAGRNIATTHQSFKFYTAETIQLIHDLGYTLIIDENVDVLEEYTIHPTDLKIMIASGYVYEEDGTYKIARDDYDGIAWKETIRILKSRTLIKFDDEELGATIYFWSLPEDLISAFSQVFVLTYLFEGQSLCNFFNLNGMDYEYIGISHSRDGEYRFCESRDYLPAYTEHLSDMINIYDKGKLNQIGDSKFALSMSWFERAKSDRDQLKLNIYNFFHNIYRSTPLSQKMWGSFSKSENVLRGKGYSQGFVIFNSRATNKYRDRTVLAYCCNLFMNTNEKNFYYKNGITPDEDKYALSIMIQWLWRSAIRDGREISVYIPSKRMRTLLKEWISQVEQEYKIHNERTAA